MSIKYVRPSWAIVLGCVWFAVTGCQDATGPISISPVPSSTAFAAAAPVGVPVYTVTRIDATIGLRVNQSGDVVGWTTSNGLAVPMLYTAQNGVIVLPSSPTQPYGVARDVSDRKDGVITVVGEAKLAATGSAIRAVRWRVQLQGGSAVVTDLGTLPGDSESFANGVNNAGQITGTSDPNSFLQIRSFIHSDASGMVDLGLGGPGQNARALDLNAAGVVTGYLGLRAFRWTSAGGLQDLGTPDGWANSFGNAINASNQVAGSASNSFGNASSVARYTDGSGWKILGGMGPPIPRRQTNSGNGINQWGDVVGTAMPRTGVSPSFKGVIYTDQLGVLAYVDDLLLVPGSWRVLEAYDINDAQQITGRAYNSQTAATSAVLLTPVSPPPANQPPVADFSYFCPPLLFCRFESSSTDDRGIVGWSWTTNGQTIGTTAVFGIQYAAPQTFDLTLAVTDTRGTIGSITKRVVIGGAVNQPPVANYGVTCSPGRCVLNARSSTDDIGIVSYAWRGSVVSRPPKTGVRITRNWRPGGGNTYQETLTVTDGGGLSRSMTKTIRVPAP